MADDSNKAKSLCGKDLGQDVFLAGMMMMMMMIVASCDCEMYSRSKEEGSEEERLRSLEKSFDFYFCEIWMMMMDDEVRIINLGNAIAATISKTSPQKLSFTNLKLQMGGTGVRGSGRLQVRRVVSFSLAVERFSLNEVENYFSTVFMGSSNVVSTKIPQQEKFNQEAESSSSRRETTSPESRFEPCE